MLRERDDPAPHRSAAVVGADGFLGRHLVRRLQQAGVPVLSHTRARPLLWPDGRPDPGLAAVGTVFWLASTINPAVAESDPGRVAADHAVFRDLLDRLPAGPRVVLVSSGGTVYDPAATPPYAESAPVRPTGAYGAAKLALERALTEALGPAAVVVRVANAYGPGQPAASGQGVVAHWLRSAAEGGPVTIYGDPQTTRDYVYVVDIADALLRVHVAAEPPAVVNVGSGRPTTLEELAEVVMDVVGRDRTELRHLPARSFDLSRTWLDVTLAEQALGWVAATGLREGVAAAWTELRAGAQVG